MAASWLVTQMRVAEGLLEAVDKSVTKTVGNFGQYRISGDESEEESSDPVASMPESQAAPAPSREFQYRGSGSSDPTRYANVPAEYVPYSPKLHASGVPTNGGYFPSEQAAATSSINSASASLTQQQPWRSHTPALTNGYTTHPPSAPAFPRSSPAQLKNTGTLNTNTHQFNSVSPSMTPGPDVLHSTSPTINSSGTAEPPSQQAQSADSHPQPRQSAETHATHSPYISNQVQLTSILDSNTKTMNHHSSQPETTYTLHPSTTNIFPEAGPAQTSPGSLEQSTQSSLHPSPTNSTSGCTPPQHPPTSNHPASMSTSRTSSSHGAEKNASDLDSMPVPQLQSLLTSNPTPNQATAEANVSFQSTASNITVQPTAFSNPPQVTAPTAPTATLPVSSPSPGSASVQAPRKPPAATSSTVPASLLLPSSAAAAAVSFLGGVLDSALGGGGDSSTEAGNGDEDAGMSPSAGGGTNTAAMKRTIQLLRGRLGTAKDENVQLEGLLHAAEVRVQREQAGCRQLQQEISTLGSAKSFAEATLQAQLAAGAAALREARESGEEVQRQLRRYDVRVIELEEANRLLQQRKDDLEGGMLEALQQQLLECEGRLEAEHRAHARSKSVAAVREQQLERAVEDSGEGLAGLQRALEEAGRRNRGTEQQLGLVAAERNELTAQLAALTATAAGGNSAAPGSGGEGSAQLMAMEMLRSEVTQHRRAAAAAETAQSAADSAAAELRVQVLRMQQEAASLKDTSPLEAQLRGASEMLVMKQAQIERLASDKAAATMRLERELGLAQQEAAAARVAAASAAARLGSAEEGYAGLAAAGGFSGGRAGMLSDMVPMDALGESYERLVRNRKVGKVVRYAAKMLDSGAATASTVLRRYPVGRLAIFLYILFIHVYVYFLTGYLQRVVGRLESSGAGGGGGALAAARGLLPVNASSSI